MSPETPIHPPTLHEDSPWGVQRGWQGEDPWAGGLSKGGWFESPRAACPNCIQRLHRIPARLRVDAITVHSKQRVVWEMSCPECHYTCHYLDPFDEVADASLVEFWEEAYQ